MTHWRVTWLIGAWHDSSIGNMTHSQWVTWPIRISCHSFTYDKRLICCNDWSCHLSCHSFAYDKSHWHMIWLIHLLHRHVIDMSRDSFTCYTIHRHVTCRIDTSSRPHKTTTQSCDLTTTHTMMMTSQDYNTMIDTSQDCNTMIAKEVWVEKGSD